MVKAFQAIFIPQGSLFETLAHLPGTLVIKDIRVPERGDFDGAKNIDGAKNTIENGKFVPSTVLAIRLSRFFEIKVEELFEGKIK